MWWALRVAGRSLLWTVTLWGLLFCSGFAWSGTLDVILVLDQSGSMKQNDPQRLLVSAASDFVGKLSPEDAAGLVLFGAQAKSSFPVAPLTPDANRTALLDEIQRIRYSDPRTNIAVGIERGLYDLKERGRPGATAILVFITDGIMDTGSAAKDAEMREWLRTRLLPEARERGVKIFSIALTEQADYALIQEMAQVTGGDYFRALGAKEVAGIFERISAKLRTPAPPPPSVAPPPSPPPPPAILAAGWLWGIAVGALVLVAAAGFVAMRRRRAPASATPATSPTMVGKSALPEQVPEAYLRDARTGKRIRLAKTVTRIGRAPDNDLVVAEPPVSSRHAEIEYRLGHFYVRDLRSTNGTWVNKERVTGETVLKSGDTVTFDEFAFTFSAPAVGLTGTMVRDVGEGTMVSDTLKRKAAASPPPEAKPPESPPPPPPPPERRPPQPKAPEPSALSGTVAIGTETTVDDSVGPPRCATHPSFEATERCDACGKLWCALCNPPVPGERVCRHCKELRKASGAGKSGRASPPKVG